MAGTLTINKAATSTALSSSVNPSVYGQPVTFKDGTTTLGSGTLRTSNGTTTASFTASGLGVGQHTITATYSGDGNFLAGTGATLTQYVNTNLSESTSRLPNGAYNLSNMTLEGGYFVNAPLVGASLN